MNGALKDTVELLNGEGLSVGALIFGDIYPLPEKKITVLRNNSKKDY